MAFSTLLTLLFIGLKLAGIIHWKWFWVVSPIFIEILFSMLLTYVNFLLNGNDKDDT